MPINEWSDSIFIAEMRDEPEFSDEMDALSQQLSQLVGQVPDVVVSLSGVTHINSSNISQLLRLRKQLVEQQARLRICAINDAVWSVIITTGLDKVFEFTDDVSTSLTSLQVGS